MRFFFYGTLLDRDVMALVVGRRLRDVAQLSAFEGPKYRIAPLRVVLAAGMTTVSVFEPVESRLAPSEHPWSLPLWQRRDKRAFVDRLRRAFSGRPAYSTP